MIKAYEWFNHEDYMKNGFSMNSSSWILSLRSLHALGFEVET